MRLEIFFLLLLCTPNYLFGQVVNCPRTDGIYLFDNGLDTVLYIDDFPIDSAAMLYQVFPFPGNDSIIIGFGDVFPIDVNQSTYISALYFEEEGMGYSLNLGIFRDKELLKRLAKLCNESQEQLTQLPGSSPIVNYSSGNNGEITFVCNRGAIYPIETFRVNSFSDTLYCGYAREVNIRTKFFTSNYFTNRIYRFISFNEILEESFVFPIK